MADTGTQVIPSVCNTDDCIHQGYKHSSYTMHQHWYVTAAVIHQYTAVNDLLQQCTPSGVLQYSDDHADDYIDGLMMENLLYLAHQVTNIYSQNYAFIECTKGVKHKLIADGKAIPDGM